MSIHLYNMYVCNLTQLESLGGMTIRKSSTPTLHLANQRMGTRRMTVSIWMCPPTHPCGLHHPVQLTEVTPAKWKSVSYIAWWTEDANEFLQIFVEKEWNGAYIYDVHFIIYNYV